MGQQPIPGKKSGRQKKGVFGLPSYNTISVHSLHHRCVADVAPARAREAVQLRARVPQQLRVRAAHAPRLGLHLRRAQAAHGQGHHARGHHDEQGGGIAAFHLVPYEADRQVLCNLFTRSSRGKFFSNTSKEGLNSPNKHGTDGSI